MPINERATNFTYGTNGNDVINAQYLLGDMIDGLGGDDVINGLDGNDTLLGSAGRDTIYGFGGNDLIDGGSGNDKLYGGLGDDVIKPDTGLSGNDLIDGGDGIDTVDYGAFVGGTRGVVVDLRINTAQDTRGAGKDTLFSIENIIGTGLNDLLTGTNGSNVLMGGNGSDTIYGLDGHDQISGGAGNDSLYGGLGNDQITPDSGGAGNDVIDGGDGIDTVNYLNSSLSSGVKVDLSLTTWQNTGGAGIDMLLNVEQVQGSDFSDTIIGSNGDNWLNAGRGNDYVQGGDGNDSIFSGGGDLLNDSLYGGNGNDRIRAAYGDDILDGGAGADILRGNLGADSLTGGAGADEFVFSISSGLGDSTITKTDLITDFNGLEDLIVLQSFEWSANIVFLGNAAFTATGVSEIRVVDDQGIQRIEVDIEGNGSADIDAAIHVVGTPLAADDFAFVSVYPF